MVIATDVLCPGASGVARVLEHDSPTVVTPPPRPLCPYWIGRHDHPATGVGLTACVPVLKETVIPGVAAVPSLVTVTLVAKGVLTPTFIGPLTEIARSGSPVASAGPAEMKATASTKPTTTPQRLYGMRPSLSD